MDPFTFNSNETDFEKFSDKGIFIKDQIFNIMCVKYARSRDVGEFYHDYDENTKKT